MSQLRSAVAGGGENVRPVGAGQSPSSHGGAPDGLRRVVASDDWEPEFVVDERHCQAIQADGSQCKSWPMKKHDSVYCAGHHRSRTAQDFIDAAVADVDASSES